jgi:hypothetical protein
LDQILQEALALPDDKKLTLAERLVESVGAGAAAEFEAKHIATVVRRLEEVQSGRVKLIPGEEALRQVREALEKGG